MGSRSVIFVISMGNWIGIKSYEIYKYNHPITNKNDKARFCLVSMFLFSTMDDLEILYKKKH